MISFHWHTELRSWDSHTDEFW